MKRSISDEPSPSKRAKIHHELFDDSRLERDPHDFLNTGIEDDSGAILETTGSTPRRFFDVELAGACIEFFSEIGLRVKDELLLALKSAEIEISANKARPIKLVYEEGVIIKFVKRLQGPCLIVDTWQLKEDARRQEDSWFLPSQTTLDKKEGKPCGPPDKQRSESPGPPDDKPLMVSAQSTDQPIFEAQEPKLSKTKRKEIYKRERALRNASKTINYPVTETTTAHAESPQLAVSGVVSVPAIVTVDSEASLPDQLTQMVPPPTTAGLVSVTGRYHQLSDLNNLANYATFNVIGIVVQASPPDTTRKGDWFCSVTLVDPSNCTAESLDGQGFKINCFTRKYKQWIPQPALGDILIMRDVKMSSYHGRMGVGYHDKLQWTVYSASTGKMRHSDLGDAPESESAGVGEGFGYPFSPFYKPNEAEIRYCLKIADWWSEIEKQRKVVGDIHQVCEPSSSALHSRPQRKHRLISEAGPHVEPSGYFDCVVEVLNGHLNDNGVYSLYVTDYTVNTAVPPVQAAWCPPGLADHVLKIEAWDDAVAMAQGMFAGEYYSIKNARMMLSHGGYVEGKIVQRKIQRLDVEDDGNVNIHFKKMLDRKKAWQAVNHSHDQTDDFDYNTIAEVAEGKHFHCVVEVIHTIHDGDGTSFIYVTDYTFREELVSGRVPDTWGTGLNGRILRIALFNNQAEMAKFVEVGSFYNIKKLRLKQSSTARQFQGQLGGVERLIFLLKPNNDDDRLNALKRRKEQWQKSLDASDAPVGVNPSAKPELIQWNPVVLGRPRKTIAELQADKKCPNKSRVSARVVDFRPWRLTDAVIIHCTHCKRDLPPLQRACFKCGDLSHDYVQYTFQMYILLEDEDGGRLYASLHDGSSIFNGLKRSDIKDDSKAYRELSDRLSKIFGNLLAFHSSPIPTEDAYVLPDTPSFSFIIDTWEADGKHVYSVAECENLDA